MEEGPRFIAGVYVPADGREPALFREDEAARWSDAWPVDLLLDAGEPRVPLSVAESPDACEGDDPNERMDCLLHGRSRLEGLRQPAPRGDAFIILPPVRRERGGGPSWSGRLCARILRAIERIDVPDALRRAVRAAAYHPWFGAHDGEIMLGPGSIAAARPDRWRSTVARIASESATTHLYDSGGWVAISLLYLNDDGRAGGGSATRAFGAVLSSGTQHVSESERAHVMHMVAYIPPLEAAMLRRVAAAARAPLSTSNELMAHGEHSRGH